MKSQAQSNRWWPRCLALAAAVMLAACTTAPDVRATYDQAVNFAQYRTFGFWEKPATDGAGYESLTTQRLKAATRREMESRGYAYAGQDADLLVNFGTDVAQRTRVHSYPGGYYGYPWGWGGGWYGYGYGYGCCGWGAWGGWNTYVDQYDEGTLNIDVVDDRRKQLVWAGSATARISDKMRDNQAQALDDAVREIFLKYPFRAGGG